MTGGSASTCDIAPKVFGADVTPRGELDLIEIGQRASWGLANESAGLAIQRHAVIAERTPRFLIRFDATLSLGRPGWVWAAR